MKSFYQDTPLPSYLPLPRFLLRGELSLNARLLYALLLSRTQLSQRNGWVTEAGRVYVSYPIQQLAEDLGRSPRTVNAALRELEKAGLLERVRKGWNSANQLFLQMPDDADDTQYSAGQLRDDVQVSACQLQDDTQVSACQLQDDAQVSACQLQDDAQFSADPLRNICASDAQVSSLCSAQNLRSNKNNIEINNFSKKERNKEERKEEPFFMLGEFQNVRLSRDGITRLRIVHPLTYEDGIERLSRHLRETGRQYQDHYTVLRRWLDEDRRRQLLQWESEGLNGSWS